MGHLDRKLFAYDTYDKDVLRLVDVVSRSAALSMNQNHRAPNPQSNSAYNAEGVAGIYEEVENAVKSRTLKRALIALVAVLCVLVCVAAVSLLLLQMRTDGLHNGYRAALSGPEYSAPVQVEGVQVITQDVSCGYAVIEMFSTWSGGNITEESLYEQYGKVVTSTGQSFCDEMNKQFPAFKTTMCKYLTDSELLAAVHASLAAGVPVPIEWAAKLGDEWTLHYSLVTGLDIPGDKVTIANPYGYVEELHLDEFLSRTRFEAYEGMPLFLRLGFAFGIFEENTVFIPERVG